MNSAKRVKTKCLVPLALSWSHCGVDFRVTPWPEVRFERRYGDEWIPLHPSEDVLASAAQACGAVAWRPYLEFVAPEAREFLLKFTYGRMEALQIAARCPALLDELAAAPALTSFVAAHATLRGLGAPHWGEIAAVYDRSGIFGMLEWLGLPASRQTLAILRNIVEPDIPKRLLEPLRSMLWDPTSLFALQRMPAITDRELARACNALAARAPHNGGSITKNALVGGSRRRKLGSLETTGRNPFRLRRKSSGQLQQQHPAVMTVNDLTTEGPRKARVEIIPLIDVVFFLLATFVLFTLSLTKIMSLDTPLPKSGQPLGGEDTTAYVQATDGGMYYWKVGRAGSAELISARELEPRYIEYRAHTAEPKVFVRGDGKAKFGPAIFAMDEARKAESDKFRSRRRSARRGIRAARGAGARAEARRDCVQGAD